MARKISNYDARRFIANRIPFESHTGNFRGVECPDVLTHWDMGYMGDAFRNDLWMNFIAGNVTYLVYSYGTPIGWHHKDEGWIIPNESYSVTTSRHQSVTRWGAAA